MPDFGLFCRLSGINVCGSIYLFIFATFLRLLRQHVKYVPLKAGIDINTIAELWQKEK